MPADSSAQLRLLALIDRHGSLAAAARALGLTPAAVTQQLARAERDWNAHLVVRGARGAVLTEAGALLAAHGRVVEERTDQAAGELAALLGGLSRRLRIGTFQAAALQLLPPALTALRHRYPDADVTVVDEGPGRGEDEVAAGRLDVAVIATWGGPFTPPPQVSVHPLLLDPMVVVLPDDHPLAVGRPPEAGLRLEQLRDDSWVAIRSGHPAREQFDTAARAAGFRPDVRFQTESYYVAQALIGSGVGVALVSRLALAGFPGTVHRGLGPHAPQRRLCAVTPADTTLTPLVDVFVGLLRDVADDIVSTWDEHEHHEHEHHEHEHQHEYDGAAPGPAR